MGLFWFGIAALLAQSQTPETVIRVPVHLVTAPTLVFTADGHLIPGLEKKDFRIFDDGHAQNFSLDAEPVPVSVVFAVQVNRDVREYVPFIARTGSTLEALLVGETGEAAVVTYNNNVTDVKAFDSGSVQTSLRKLSARGKQARMIDAGERAITLLEERPSSRSRVIVFIGQASDNGSESKLDALRERAERGNIAIYALTLPEAGKSFVSDTFSIQGPASAAERGGFKVDVDLLNLGAVLTRTAAAASAADPFTVLTGAVGGAQLHFRTQAELEHGIAMIGVALRSGYLLNYSPVPAKPGYHTITVRVNISGARTSTRPGYWLGAH